MKRYNATITHSKSIQDLIKNLEKYRDGISSKSEIFVRRLADIGVNAAMMTLASKGAGDSDRNADFSISFEYDNESITAVLSITSEPTITEDGRKYYPHLGWEFGVGNRYNGTKSPNPMAEKMGMGPGTFPNQKHVPNPGFWYYVDNSGNKHKSYGTQAIMPMYTAGIEVFEQIETIAKEVFGNG